jgi:hypothetical protein
VASATVIIGAVLPRSGFFSILGFALVATGTKMLWNRVAYPEKKALAIKEPELKSETDLEEKEKNNFHK